jgi:PAS domain S-box-containing protein
MTPAEIQTLVHDLRVHQIELELQNDELRRTQSELADSRARYFDLYDLAPVGYITFSESGLIQQANLTAAILLGATRDSLVGQPIFKFINRDDQDRYYLSRKAFFEPGPASVCELRMVKLDESVFWARLQGVATAGPAGTVHCRCVLSDITAQRQFEESVRIKSWVFDASITANSISNSEGIITEANAEFLRIWGYSHRDEVVGQPITHFFAHSSEATPIRASLDGMGHWEGEFTALRKDGSTFLSHGLATIVLDLQGRIAGYQSVVLDISERSLMKAALQKSETRYRDIFEFAVDGILQGDSEGIITGANEQMLQLAGRSMEQVLGVHVRDLFAPAELQAKPLKFDLLDEAQVLVTERNLLRPDGSILPVEMHSKRMPDGTYHSIYRDITERRQAEANLRESQELLSLFLRHSPIYSFIKTVTPTESRVLYASENYQDMVGIAGSELAGKTMTDLFPAELAAKILADDIAVVATGKILSVDEDFDGRNYTTLKFPIVQGNTTLLAGYTMDITERKQAEEALRDWNQTLERRVAERTAELEQSHDRYQKLTEVTFEGIAVTKDGVVLDCNPQFAGLFGYAFGEMVGCQVVDLVEPESRTWVAQNLNGNSEVNCDFVGMRKDGTIFPAQVRSYVGTWMGQITRISAIRDLSEIKEAHARLLRTQSELENVQLFALVSEVNASIIHQISQPLCAISINIAAVMRQLNECMSQAGDLPLADSLEIIRDMDTDVIRMREVVTHLRRLIAPEKQSLPKINFNQVVEGILPLLREKAASCNVRLLVDLGGGFPPVSADAVQISQVIYNLMHNALEASEGCALDRRVVALTTRVLDGNQVELSLRDAGIGIAPASLPNLFRPFFSTKPAGFGIGLRISRTIVETLGGSIQGYNNADGVGATFRVVLPVNQPNRTFNR